MIVINRWGGGVTEAESQTASWVPDPPASQSGKSVKADQLYQVHKAKVVKITSRKTEGRGDRLGFLGGGLVLKRQV